MYGRMIIETFENGNNLANDGKRKTSKAKGTHVGAKSATASSATDMKRDTAARQYAVDRMKNARFSKRQDLQNNVPNPKK